MSNQTEELPEVMTIDRTLPITDEAARFAATVMRKQRTEQDVAQKQGVAFAIHGPLADNIQDWGQARQLFKYLVEIGFTGMWQGFPVGVSKDYVLKVVREAANHGLQTVVGLRKWQPVVNGEAELDQATTELLQELAAETSKPAFWPLDEPIAQGYTLDKLDKLTNGVHAVAPGLEVVIQFSGEVARLERKAPNQRYRQVSDRLRAQVLPFQIEGETILFNETKLVEDMTLTRQAMARVHPQKDFPFDIGLQAFGAPREAPQGQKYMPTKEEFRQLLEFYLDPGQQAIYPARVAVVQHWHRRWDWQLSFSDALDLHPLIKEYSS